MQPLDYLGLPFRCYRCHELGHLANNCSLSFKKISSSKSWRVKKDWNQPHAKAGISVETLDSWKAKPVEIQSIIKVGSPEDENLDVPSVSQDLDPLANLKQICFANSRDENLLCIPSSEAFVPPIPISSLKDLGFVSPCKALISKGYFLRSSTKPLQEISRTIDKVEFSELEEGLIGDSLLMHSAGRGAGALRAAALSQVPL